MKAFFIKRANGHIYAYDEPTKKYIKNRKPGQIITADITRARNYEFHKKAFSLFQYMLDIMPPPEPIEFRGEMIQPEQNIDSIRKYLTVKAGYYDVIGYPNGSVRVEAQSLSYEKMEPEEFERCYSATIDACLKALPDHWSDAEKDRVANHILKYD